MICVYLLRHALGPNSQGLSLSSVLNLFPASARQEGDKKIPRALPVALPGVRWAVQKPAHSLHLFFLVSVPVGLALLDLVRGRAREAWGHIWSCFLTGTISSLCCLPAWL